MSAIAAELMPIFPSAQAEELAALLTRINTIINKNPSAATLGSELVTNGTFATTLVPWTFTNWTWSAGFATHTAGNTSPLSQSVTVTGATTYLLTYTTSGTFTVAPIATINGTVVTNYNSVETDNPQTNNGIYVSNTQGAVTLAFTPESGFAGKISAVSLKAITANISPALTFLDSTGTDYFDIRGSAALSNLALGRDALFKNTSGTNNFALGRRALSINVTGFENTAIGNQALNDNGTGYGNTAIGYNSQLLTTSGFLNTSIGVNTLAGNTIGCYNIAIGNQALILNTTGLSNTAIGVNALYNNLAANYNVAIGVDALAGNSTGAGNCAIGVYSISDNNHSGNYNNAIGYGSLRLNISGSGNEAYGQGCLEGNTTGSFNVALGDQALSSNSSGSENIALGHQSLYTHATGDYNIGIGYLTGVIGGGHHDDAGSHNIWMGYRAGPDVVPGTVLTNSIAIGKDSHVTKSHEIQLGNTSHTETQLYGSVVAGTRAALLTTATDGFLYVPTCAGAPTGVPTTKTGMAPIIVNTTNNKVYFYSGGIWRDAGP